MRSGIFHPMQCASRYQKVPQITPIAHKIIDMDICKEKEWGHAFVLLHSEKEIENSLLRLDYFGRAVKRVDEFV